MRMQTMLLIGVTSKTHYGVPNQTLKWHQDILDALGEGNASLAGQVLTDHLMDAMGRATKRFNEVARERMWQIQGSKYLLVFGIISQKKSPCKLFSREILCLV